MAAGAKIGDLRAQAAAAAGDASLSDGERRSKLRALRDGMRDAAAAADLVLRDGQRRQEAAAATRAADHLFASSASGLREALAEAGVDAELLAEAGLPSLVELEELREEGLLESVIGGMRKAWEERLHPRGRGGKFEGVFHAPKPKEPRGAKGAKLPKLPEVPRPPEPPSPAAAVPKAPSPAVPGKTPAAPAAPKPAKLAQDATPLERRLLESGAIDEATLAAIHERGLNLPQDELRARSELAGRLLGSARDTQDLYRDPETKRYSAERKKLHDQIVSELLDPHSPSERKSVLFMAGGTASGKSSVLGMPENVSLTPHDAVTIDADQIKSKLPEYQQMVEAHDVFAASAVHEESSDLSKRVLAEAQERGLNIVVDAVGDSTGSKFQDTIAAVKGNGYDTRVVMVDATLPAAVSSMVRRAHETGRYVPLEVMDSGHRNSVARHLEWRDSPDVDEWSVYHRGDGEFALVATGGAGGAAAGKPNPAGAGKQNPGRAKVLDEAGYAEVLAKAPGLGKGAAA